MRALSEIIENHLDSEGKPDIPAILEEASAEMGSLPQLDPLTHLVLTKQYVDWALKYLGGIVLAIAAEMGALPNGFDQEYQNLETDLEFHQFSQFYDLKWASTQKKIEVPGQMSIPITDA